MQSHSIGDVDQNYIAPICSDLFARIAGDLTIDPDLKALAQTSRQLEKKVSQLPWVIGDINHNYMASMSLEVFERLTAHFPYNSTLKNLAITSKELQCLVYGLPCGAVLNDLDTLQPSYLRALFAKDFNCQAFVIGSGYVGLAIGAYINYDTILSTYLGMLGGSIAGHFVSSAVVGYVIDGVEGAKTGVCAYANLLNVAPYVKLALKPSLAVIDKILPVSTSKLIKETPMELLDVYCKGAYKSLNVFSQANRDYERNLRNERIEKQSKQRQLSQPIVRKGS